MLTCISIELLNLETFVFRKKNLETFEKHIIPAVVVWWLVWGAHGLAQWATASTSAGGDFGP
jgi:hypothetical protein